MDMIKQSSHRGLRDWLVQRATAVIIGVYTIFLVVYIFANQPLPYTQWKTLFDCLWMKAATVIVVAAVLWHAWIGLWTVFTDYVKNRAVRAILETIVLVLLFGYLVWVVEIFWG